MVEEHLGPLPIEERAMISADLFDVFITFDQPSHFAEQLVITDAVGIKIKMILFMIILVPTANNEWRVKES